jgi:PIN domain nuclease of toxin-antitoxin system
VRLLLDTPIMLWWLAAPGRLARSERRAITEPANEVWVSAASLWEAALRRARGSLRFDSGEMLQALEADGIRELRVSGHHALTAGALPAHHDNPLDRLLVAQAVSEGLTLITRKHALRAYQAVLFRR